MFNKPSLRAIKSFCCIVPMVLLGITEMFKNELIAALNGGVAGLFAYNGMRLACIVAFIATFCIVWRPVGASTNSETYILPAPRHIADQNDPLLGLRFVAFLMVLLGHWFLVVFPVTVAANPAVAPGHWWPIGASPWAGVWVFFTLSGYLMATGFIRGRYGLDRAGILTFYKRRALRIVPIYLSAALIVGLFTTPEMFKIWDADGAIKLLNLFVFDTRGGTTIGALWSVATECQFYVMVPFIIIFAEALKSKPVVFCAAFVLSIALVVAHKLGVSHGRDLLTWHAMILQPTIVNFDVFLIGVGTAYAVEALKTKQVTVPGGLQVASFLLLILYLGCAYIHPAALINGTSENHELFISIAPVTVAFVTGIIIVLFVQRRIHDGKPASRIASMLWWLTAQGGALTYVLYVWSEPVMIALRKVAPPSLDIVTSLLYFVVIGVHVLLAFSIFFYRTVELPFNKK